MLKDLTLFFKDETKTFNKILRKNVFELLDKLDLYGKEVRKSITYSENKLVCG